MHYVVGDISTAMEYWKASLGGYFGWGEYFLGRYQYSHGDSYSAVKNWEKGAGKGNVPGRACCHGIREENRYAEELGYTHGSL